MAAASWAAGPPVRRERWVQWLSCRHAQRGGQVEGVCAQGPHFTFLREASRFSLLEKTVVGFPFCQLTHFPLHCRSIFLESRCPIFIQLSHSPFSQRGFCYILECMFYK